MVALKVAGAVAAVAATLGMAGWRLYDGALRRPLPGRISSTTIPGLQSAVEIVRDPWSVPHIRAACLADAFAAQGYVHAQDRLFQLELNRRLGAGRLAELFGHVALPADRLIRRIGLRRAAEAELESTTPDSLHLLSMYAAGINAGLRTVGATPLELRLLGCTPEPWTALDSLAYAKFLSWSLSFNMHSELVRARLVSKVGPVVASKLEPALSGASPAIVAADATPVLSSLLEDMRGFAPFADLFGHGASNAWVVSGQRSATSGPILCSDPHLPLQFPSVWYEVHVTCPECNVAGAGLVGFPGVGIGHNGYVAWGLTASAVDTQDLYLERFDPARPRSYQVNGEWREAEIVQEVIYVKGQADPVVEEVRITRHGPVVGVADGSSVAVALRWTSHGLDRFLDTLVGVNTSRSMAELRSGLRRLGGLSLSVIFGTVDGDIGYQLAGAIPERPAGVGPLPVPGWSSDFEWGLPIPFDRLPALTNPSGGTAVSANNFVGGAAAATYLGADWFNGYRATRIAHLLSERERLTMADHARIQADVLSLPGLELQQLMHQLDRSLLSLRAQHAFDLFLAWDGEVRPESAGAVVYGRLMPAVMDGIVRPLLGNDTEMFLGLDSGELGPNNDRLGRFIPVALDLLRSDDLANAVGRGSGALGDRYSVVGVLAAAIERAAADLHDLLGPNLADWSWGRLHRVTWQHPLGRVQVLAPLFNRGPFELPGDSETVNYGASFPHPPVGHTEHCWVAGYRIIVDLADPTRSVAVVAGGQSGQPGSPHYADQLGAWRSGRHRLLMYEDEAIDKAALGRATLFPGS